MITRRGTFFGTILLAILRSHAKMRLKSTPQKMNFVMEKALSKSYTLGCSCKHT